MSSEAAANVTATSPANSALYSYLIERMQSPSDGVGLSPVEWGELQIDCMHALTDGVRHRRALDQEKLVAKVKEYRSNDPDAPEMDDEALAILVVKALEPLKQNRLVREQILESGERQYELAHDYAVRAVRDRWQELVDQRTGRRAQRDRRFMELAAAVRRGSKLISVMPLYLPPKACNAKILGWKTIYRRRLHIEYTDVRAAGTSNEASATKDPYRLASFQSNPSTVEQPTNAPRIEVEHARSFLKKLALLGEKQGKSRQIDLLIVGLHLRKVRVHRQVERKIRRRIVLQIDPGFVRRVAIERITSLGAI